MNAIERTIRTLEGKPVDRVPTFCAMVEDRTFNEILGQPPFHPHKLIDNPLSDYLFRKWGPLVTKIFFQPMLTIGMERRIKAAAVLGFDADWAIYEESFIPMDSKSMVRFTGSIYDIIDDGYGNSSYMYRGPGITSRKDFEEWPHWRNPDEVAHRAYKFFQKIMKTGRPRPSDRNAGRVNAWFLVGVRIRCKERFAGKNPAIDSLPRCAVCWIPPTGEPIPPQTTGRICSAKIKKKKHKIDGTGIF